MPSPLVIATDGSCLKNPGGAIGWAWADDRGRWQANGLPSGTNQTAELLGLISALEAFPNTPLHLLLDSQYALNIAEKWMYGWQKKGWYRDAQKTQPVSNLMHVKHIYSLVTSRKERGIPTTFQWVKGHSVTELNNVADVRAQEAARRVKAKQSGYADSANNAGAPKQTALTAAYLPHHS